MEKRNKIISIILLMTIFICSVNVSSIEVHAATNELPTYTTAVNSYKSSNNTVATVDSNGVETSKSEGTTTVTIETTGNNNYNASSKTLTVTVSKNNIGATDILTGDVNGDNSVNMKDFSLLQQFLHNWDVTIDYQAADVNADNKINMKDYSLFQRYLNGWDVELMQSSMREVDTDDNESCYTQKIYGKSELGRDLEYYSFEPDNYKKTLLLNFAIHGFEDEYDADGQVLVDTANSLISYYTDNFDKLQDTRLIIIPCANPDGLYEGTTNNGFGRCNANGVDLNRDFDANYTSYASDRNYTPYAFSAAESRALRDLVYSTNPDIVIDFHGWLDYTIGNYELAQVFSDEMGLSHHVDFTTTNAAGYFSNWTYQQGALSLLVEFTNSNAVPIDKLVNVINRLLSDDYNSFEKASKFSQFDKINCYTLSTDRVTTYKFFHEPFSSASYIDGTTDTVIILEMYENGWAKVQYPISSGSKVAYALINDFISEEDAVENIYELNLEKNTTAYKRSNLEENFGTIYPTDNCYVVADSGNALQVIYELDTSGWKMGWIKKDNDNYSEI